MKKIAVATVVVFAVMAYSALQGQSQEPNKVSVFMRLKLRHSQKVLEGLVTEDYSMIAKNAQEISLLSLASTWQVLETDEYAKLSGEFRRTADALTKAAKEKNLDEATLKYVDLTMKCVNCHKYVRGVRLTDASTLDTFVTNSMTNTGR